MQADANLGPTHLLGHFISTSGFADPAKASAAPAAAPAAAPLDSLYSTGPVDEVKARDETQQFTLSTKGIRRLDSVSNLNAATTPFRASGKATLPSIESESAPNSEAQAKFSHHSPSRVAQAKHSALKLRERAGAKWGASGGGADAASSAEVAALNSRVVALERKLSGSLEEIMRLLRAREGE